MKKTIFIFLIFTLCSSYSKIDLQQAKGSTLDSVFPIDNILSVTIRNIHRKHKLTDKELSELKSKLKFAKYTGGLLEKPGHIFLEIQLKKTKCTKPMFVYASKGYIHFDKGIDLNNKEFVGTYTMPGNFAFDKYK